MTKICPVCKEKFESKNARKFCGIACRLKANKKPIKNTKKSKETLCWSCKNAVCGCSWSKDFTPVKGWKAIPTKVRGNVEINEWIDSFLIVDCPKYKED